MKDFIEGYLAGLIIIASFALIVFPVVLAVALNNPWWLLGLVVTVPLIAAFMGWDEY